MLERIRLNYVMNLEGDGFFESYRVATLSDTLTIRKIIKTKDNQITQLDAKLKTDKGQKGKLQNNSKVHTEGAVAKSTERKAYVPKVTDDRKSGPLLWFSCQSPNHVLKDCPSKPKTKPYQEQAYIPLVLVTCECSQSLSH